MKPLRPAVTALFPCLALLALAASAASASPVFHPGLEAGWQSSTFLYTDLNSFWAPGWANTFTGGATLDLSVTRSLGFATGMRYVSYSNRVTLSGLEDLVGDFRVHAHYVAIPALVRFSPGPGGPRLAAGTEVAFLTSARSDGNPVIVGLFPPFSSRSRDVTDHLQTVNVSLCGTLGLARPFGNHLAIAQLRFTHGLTDAGRDEDWVTNWKTMGLDGTLGLSW